MSEIFDLNKNDIAKKNLIIELDNLRYSPKFEIETVQLKNIFTNKDLSFKGKVAWLFRCIASGLDHKKNFAYTINTHLAITNDDIIEGFTVGFSVMLKHLNELTHEKIELGKLDPYG